MHREVKTGCAGDMSINEKRGRVFETEHDKDGHKRKVGNEGSKRER